MKRAILPVMILVLAPLSVVSAAVHRVPQDFATITAALAAAGPGDTVAVDSGTYAPSTNGETFPLAMTTGGIQLLGSGMDVTVLDAQGTAGVIVHDAVVGGRISGFRITGGIAPRGGGVRIENGDAEVDHNAIVENGADLQGAGLFVGNAAAPWVHHNLILDSFSTGLPDVHGAVFSSSARGVFEHNLIAGTDGNGLLTSAHAAPSVRHNIFYRNGIPSPERGRGICWLSDGEAAIFHNLFFENQVAAVLWTGGGGDLSGAAANAVDPDDGVYGNLDADPLFVDPDSGDFHLQPTSPAIDAGDPGLPRDPDGTIADIGPFPYQDVSAVPPPPAAAITVSSAPNPVRTSCQIRFGLPERGFVRMEVLDPAGRRVRTLDPGLREAGWHEVPWDGADDASRLVRSGVYHVRVRAGALEGSLPVVVVR